MKKINIPESTKAEGLLSFTTLLWGLTFVVIKQGLNDSSPLMFLCLRFSIAFVVYALIFRKHFSKFSRRTIFRGILLSLFFFSGYAFQTIGLKYTTVAKSALFTYMFAVLVPPLQYFFTGKRPKMLNVTALAVVFAGIVIYTAPGSSTFNIGDAVTLIGAVGYSFFIIFVDRYTGKEDPVVLTGFQFLVSSVMAGLMSVFFEDTFVIPTINLAVSIFYLAIPGSVIAIFFMNKYQGMTTPVKACIIYAMEPVFTIIFGWILINETLSSGEIFGAVLIIAGVIFTEIYGVMKSGKNTPRAGRGSGDNSEISLSE